MTTNSRTAGRPPKLRQHDDLPARERDVARRIAAAQFGVLRVVHVLPGRWIDLRDLAVGGEVVRAISHDVSRSARPRDLLVGRLMDGPPAPTLWGSVGFLTLQSGRELRTLLDTYMDAFGLGDAAGGPAAAMHAAAREITVMLVRRWAPPTPPRRQPNGARAHPSNRWRMFHRLGRASPRASQWHLGLVPEPRAGRRVRNGNSRVRSVARAGTIRPACAVEMSGWSRVIVPRSCGLWLMRMRCECSRKWSR